MKKADPGAVPASNHAEVPAHPKEGMPIVTHDQATPLLLKVEEAAERLGIGRTKLYSLVMSGEIESVPVGRLRRIPAECLDEYVQRLRDRARKQSTAA